MGTGSSRPRRVHGKQPLALRARRRAILAGMKFLLALLVVLGLAACGERSDVRPVLVDLPFRLEPRDAQDRAGDLDFHDEVSQGKVLLEFGGRLIDQGTGPAGVILPHLTVRLGPTATVRAAAPGVVVAVERNTDSSVADDFEVRIAAAEGSRWELGYDHVASPQVAAGDVVEAGAALGTGISAKKFELDVYDTGDGNRRYCPNLFFAPARAAVLEAQLTRLFAEWEAYKGDPSIYDEAAMFRPGCAVESIAGG